MRLCRLPHQLYVRLQGSVSDMIVCSMVHLPCSKSFHPPHVRLKLQHRRLPLTNIFWSLNHCQMHHWWRRRWIQEADLRLFLWIPTLTYGHMYVLYRCTRIWLRWTKQIRCAITLRSFVVCWALLIPFCYSAVEMPSCVQQSSKAAAADKERLDKLMRKAISVPGCNLREKDDGWTPGLHRNTLPPKETHKKP